MGDFKLLIVMCDLWNFWDKVRMKEKDMMDFLNADHRFFLTYKTPADKGYSSKFDKVKILVQL